MGAKANFSIDFSVQQAVGAGVSLGMAVVPLGSGYVPSTSANRASAGRRGGIAITTPDQNGSFAIQYAGEVTASVTGLGAGASSFVRSNAATGFLERIAAPLSSDEVWGTCDASGNLSITPAFTGAARSLGAVNTIAAGAAVVAAGANLANPATTANLVGTRHYGIALAAGAVSGSLPVAAAGDTVAASVTGLGAGVACAVGSDASGNVRRVTDPLCTSGLKYLGYTDTSGNVTVQPVQKLIYIPEDFGATGDGVTNDKAAIDACIAGAGAVGGLVQFDSKTYLYSGSDLSITNHVEIRGSQNTASTLSAGLGTRILLSSGHGVIIGPSAAAAGTVLESMSIYSQDAWNNNLNAGGPGPAVQPGSGKTLVLVQRTATLRHLFLSGATGHGVEVDSSSSNADDTLIDDVYCYGNAGYGFYFHGPDSSTCVTIHARATGNGLWGLYDIGFLGNTHLQLHLESNRLGSCRCDNTAGQSVLVHPYAEGDQGPAYLLSPTIVFGGNQIANGFVGLNSSFPDKAGTGSAWAANFNYQQGAVVDPGLPGVQFRCGTSSSNWPSVQNNGTSGGSAPTWDSTPGHITIDHQIVWECIATSVGGAGDYATVDIERYRLGRLATYGDSGGALLQLKPAGDPGSSQLLYSPPNYTGRYGFTRVDNPATPSLAIQGASPSQPSAPRYPPPGSVTHPIGLYLGGDTSGANERLIHVSTTAPTRGVAGDRVLNATPDSNGVDSWAVRVTGASDAMTFSTTTYKVGDLVKPTAPNGFVYEVRVPGLTTTEPAWPTGAGGTVTSGAVTFRLFGRDMTSNASSLYLARSEPRRGFLMTDVASATLKGWWSGDYAQQDTNSNPTGNGDTITHWRDRSGNSADLAAAGGGYSAPTTVLLDPSFGGQQSGAFSASGILVGSLVVAQPFTIFLAGYGVPGGVNNVQLIDGAGLDAFIQIDHTSHAIGMYAGTLQATTVDGTFAHVMAFEFNGATSAAYIDALTPVLSGVNPGANGLGAIALGGYAGATVNGAIGNIAEAAVFSGLLSNVERRAALRYLGAKYRITIGS